MKLDEVLDSSLNEYVDFEAMKDNPDEAFARELLILYRKPEASHAHRAVVAMLDVYGKKEVARLIAKAEEVLALLKNQ